MRAALQPEWELALANDIDPKKCRAYAENWGAENLIEGDIANLDPRLLRQPIDLYWASSPCQDLSLAGSRRGLAGSRSSAFFKWMNLVRSVAEGGFAPRILAFENVGGLITSNGGRDFTDVLRAFYELGYRFGALEINADTFLPQSRPRIFVVASRMDVVLPGNLVCQDGLGPFVTGRIRRFVAGLPDDLKLAWVWWRLSPPKVVRPSLSELIELSASTFLTSVETSRILSIMDGASLGKVELARRTGQTHVGTIYKRGRPDEFGIVRQRAELRMDGIAGCLRTPAGGSSRQIVAIIRNDEVRMRLLTAREAVRLMGLPDSYRLPNSYNEGYKIAGDGVAVPVVRFLKDNLFQPLLDCGTHRVAA